MADKFPEIDTPTAGGDDEYEGDFLSREKELVGDEFTTDQDKQVFEDDEDDEINEFKEQFPEVDTKAEPSGTTGAEGLKDDDDDDDEFEGSTSSNGAAKELNLSESQAIKEWKQRRDLEIEEREKLNSKKKEELIEKAKSTIDDFYENYNTKRDNHQKEILQEQEKFISKRDDFLKRGTLWDRVNELVTEVGELPGDESRDKTRFKELLTKLKGKENVPGAGGYQE